VADMMTTDLGACEWFVWDLRRSNLIDRGQLDQVIGEFLNKNPGAEPPALADYLIKQGILTEFQSERLLQRKTQGLVLGPSILMSGADAPVRILDFGIGCLLAETEGESLVDTMSTANSVSSGLDCASPESIMDPTNLTPIGDQYSLGCVMYYCLTGRYPFPDGSAAEKMMAHQFKEPRPLRELNPEVPA